MTDPIVFARWEQNRLPFIDITPNDFEFYCSTLDI